MTEAAIGNANNDLHQLIYDHHSRAGADDDSVVLDIEKPLGLLGDDAGGYVDWLELVVLGGQMSAALREELLAHIASLTPVPTQTDDGTGDASGSIDDTPVPEFDDATALSIVLDTLFMSIASPDHYVQ